MKQLLKIGTIVCFTMSSFCVQATVKPNSLFADNMVLQRGVEVPVWGTAKDGESVTVEFLGQKRTTVTSNGKWIIKLAALKEGGPFEMRITGENTVTIKNILVGEVWLCSGQSNMGFPVRSVRAIGNYPKVDEVLKDAQNYPMVRQFAIPLKKYTATPAIVDDVNGKWKVCDSITAKDFTAVGYFFARELYKKLNIPIGIINSSYGGTQCENWISKETLESFPELSSIFTNYQKAMSEFAGKVEKYKVDEAKLLEKYSADSAIAVTAKKELPRKPTIPLTPAERGGPTGLYNTMISPLMPYAIKGAVWYQGEANGGRGLQYRTLLPALINNWRSKWGIGDFPFLIVQIPGWKGHQPELREAQLLTWQKVPNTTMTVINDCDDTLDVHPGNKQPVGERLSLAARAIAYGEKIEYAGPVYESMKIDGSTIILSFSHLGKGLVAKDGELKDFVIAGSDKKFVPAKAVIKGNTVVVSADGINNPVAVRLGWRLSPQVNLYNQEGLPATPFRTDIQ
jgi:sialate O-acetylesterase